MKHSIAIYRNSKTAVRYTDKPGILLHHLILNDLPELLSPPEKSVNHKLNIIICRKATVR